MTRKPRPTLIRDASPEGLETRAATGGFTRRQMLWLMAMASGGLVTGCAVNPVTGQRQFIMMSPEEEKALDQENAPHQLSADYGVVQDAALRNYVTGVGRPIGGSSHRPDMPYSYNTLNANYVNAYAFPGGTIGITRGILLEMESEAELAALIGHEVAHVSARHTAQRMSKSTITGIVVAGLGAVLATQVDDTRAALALGLGGVAAGALLARYSRNDERQADNLGLEYMTKAGYNPQGMVDLMDMLRAMNSRQPSMLEQMFSSHPMSDERYRTTRREAESTYARYANAPMHRERYMDNTAALRRLQPAIRLQQQAEAAAGQRNFAEAERLLNDALRQAPNDYTGLVLMAKVLMVQDKHNQAKPFLDRAIAAYPQEAQAQHLAGLVALEQGQAQTALNRFQQYEQLLPGNPNTQFFLGLSHEGLGQEEQANQSYRRYLESGGSGESANYARQRLTGS